MIEKAAHVTIFWNLARNPEKNSSKIRRKNAKFEFFAIELMNIHSFDRKNNFAIFDENIEIRERCKGVQPAEAEGSPHPTVSQQPALSSQQSPRTLLSTEYDTAYVTGLGYDGTSSPSSPAGFDGSAVLQAGELPSSGVT